MFEQFMVLCGSTEFLTPPPELTPRMEQNLSNAINNSEVREEPADEVLEEWELDFIDLGVQD